MLKVIFLLELFFFNLFEFFFEIEIFKFWLFLIFVNELFFFFVFSIDDDIIFVLFILF